MFVSAQTRQVTDAEVMRVHRSALLIDTHNDVPMKTVKGFDIGKASTKGSTDIPRLRAGNVGATFFAAYVPGRYARQKTPPITPEKSSIRFETTSSRGTPDTFVFARTADDIVSALARERSRR